MRKSKVISTYIKLGLAGILCTPFFATAKAGGLHSDLSVGLLATPDSIGTEIVNGEVYIIHRVESKDTYYALGRRYKAQVNAIMSANNKKNLKPGDTVKIPTGRRPAPQVPAAANQRAPQQQQQEQQEKVLTEYKVGKSETLYAIARRFNTTIDEIKKMNSLSSNTVKEGQMLKIPNSDYQEPLPEIIEQPIIDTPSLAEQHTQDLGFEANRYGIREKQEKGIGVWIDNLETDGKSNLALHKTAPVGTILKITNPMTKNVTYAKVVGKFTDTADTRDAIVVLSKSAASYIGALDRRFLIEIAYGVPLQ
ncbi:LysM domain-containing protein [Sphingobacterium allocomposti]|uniref:LysM domain-containing protein n=1 Tax=Sphingobacterium allocomposti TaxID=415956 RepID=A0A5S5DSF9_9SPHI|nr:LysM peptidoglycan-binding domain-containing protein [Sphingobacterium composti Yoo et al. 2007 non Ten et al. 2007]TYP97792.1 LysM domain-containing protein [Sphingobacterium composti Yoo et al. 2007 non Ten et al. 2007]